MCTSNFTEKREDVIFVTLDLTKSLLNNIKNWNWNRKAELKLRSVSQKIPGRDWKLKARSWKQYLQYIKLEQD